MIRIIVICFEVVLGGHLGEGWGTAQAADIPETRCRLWLVAIKIAHLALELRLLPVGGIGCLVNGRRWLNRKLGMLWSRSGGENDRIWFGKHRWLGNCFW